MKKLITIVCLFCFYRLEDEFNMRYLHNNCKVWLLLQCMALYFNSSLTAVLLETYRDKDDGLNYMAAGGDVTHKTLFTYTQSVLLAH